MSPKPAAKKKCGLRFSFFCRCRNSKSVSVSSSTSNSSERLPPQPPQPQPPPPAAANPRWPRGVTSSSSGDTQTSAASSSMAERDRDHEENSEETTSFSGLLRQLNDLEQSVNAWESQGRPPAAKEDYRQHRRCRSEGGKVGESVAVVKETEDPLGDFRQSMLQMIVEKEIVGGPELRDLLRLFLTLNSPIHHGLILRAFAEIWTEVFSGYEEPTDLLWRSFSHRPMVPPGLY